MPRADPWKITHARRLRRQSTDAERCLWQCLRGFREAHWRRQALVLGYIVDFYSRKAALVVEVDGGQHFKVVGQERDQRRGEILESAGLHVLRYDNATLLQQTAAVVDDVWRIWNERK